MHHIKCVLIFLVVFIATMFSINTLEHFFAKQTISRDALLLSERFETVVSESILQLAELPEVNSNTFQCDESFVRVMRENVFDAHFFRWVGVTKGNQVLCETNSILHDIMNIETHRFQEGYSIGILNDAENVHHELILVRHMGDFNYIASLIPLNPRLFIPTECENCLKYLISFDSDPILTFGFNGFVGKEIISNKVVITTEFYEANFILSGNSAFYNQYRTLSWIVSTIFSLLFATLIVFFYLRWQQHVISMKTQMLQGVNNGEFVPYYQPIIDSRSDEIVGCEVLMRWKKADGTLIPPNQFIPYAESQGLILPMTECLLNNMVNDIQQLAMAKKPLFFSINLVPEHLENDKLYEKINTYVNDNAIGQHRFSLEITERLPIKDLTSARVILDKFYALGIDLKLDDAGTGYGGFSYVQNLGISTLKIDKMFVDTIGNEDNFNSKTIEAIISFSEKSGLSMIAEGVEEKSQLKYLADKGVFLIQGYVYSRPLDKQAFFSKY